MDDLIRMLGLMDNVLTMGDTPALSHLLTEENLKQVDMIKNCIYFCADPDPQEPSSAMEYMAHDILSQGHTYSPEYLRGILAGIMIGITTETEMEIGDLYDCVQSLLFEKSIE